MKNLSVIISKIQNPYLNLALEDWLFRNTQSTHTLLLYRNTPCVVIGRNQNPWKEISINANLPLVRRNSGGGTVYHDLGNTNYCHIMPRDLFHRSVSVGLVTDAVVNLGIKAYVNGRYDIEVDGRKVSGSAYKLANKKAYHHGTMLIESDLDQLEHLLEASNMEIVGGGIGSFRSKVTRLREFSNTVNHTTFCEAVIQRFKGVYGEAEVKSVDYDSVDVSVKSIAANLKHPDWIYAQTPKFTINIHRDFDFGSFDIALTIKEAIIIDCKVEGRAKLAEQLELFLIGTLILIQDINCTLSIDCGLTNHSCKLLLTHSVSHDNLRSSTFNILSLLI